MEADVPAGEGALLGNLLGTPAATLNRSSAGAGLCAGSVLMSCGLNCEGVEWGYNMFPFFIAHWQE